MTAKLEKELRREVALEGEPYVIAIDPLGLKLTRKGHRKGVELAWKALVSGEAALAVALNASLRTTSSKRAADPARTRRSKRKSASQRTAERRPRRAR